MSELKIAAARAAATAAADIRTKEKADPSAQEDPNLTLVERMREARAKAEEQRERFKLPKNTNYGDVPVEAYARLARAKTHAQVNAASGYAMRQISVLKAALRTDGDNANRIRAAIGQLEKAVRRAGGKKRQLDKEQLLAKRRQKAALAKQKRKAEQLGYELGRRRTMRMLRENGYINEAVIDSRLQSQLAAAQMELKAQMHSLQVPAADTSLPISGSAQQYVAAQYTAAAATAMPPAAPAAVDIQI